MPSRKSVASAEDRAAREVRLGKVLILDNGGSEIKYGSSDDSEPRIFPNAITRSKGDKKTYIGDQVEACVDFGSLVYRLPIERGFISDWNTQKAIWDHCALHKSKVDYKSSTLVLTEPCFNLPNIQQVYDEVIFEEYGFANYLRAPAPLFSSFNDLDDAFLQKQSSRLYDCVLVVDVGFSFTHAVPIYRGQVIWSAVKRLDVGGKLLTNHLKELVSFRQWYMMDQTWIMNMVKESVCYTSQTFAKDLETVHADTRANDIVREYVLPDFSPENRFGRVRIPGPRKAALEEDKDEQVLVMANERFSIPEIVFQPSLLGLDQAGVAETVATSISSVPARMQGLFWANIVVTGGSSKSPGFKDRLCAELSKFCPERYRMRVHQDRNPSITAWTGARNLATKHPERLEEMVVTKTEYEEHGFNICRTRFGETNDHVLD